MEGRMQCGGNGWVFRSPAVLHVDDLCLVLFA
jgi:hypothetical protein